MLSDQQQFISETATNFYNDTNQVSNPQQFAKSINQYDKQVYDHLQGPYPGQQVSYLNSQQKQLSIPKEGSLVDHFIRNSFMTDQNALRQYNTIQTPPLQPPPYQGPSMDQMDRQLGKSFIPLHQNYLEYNVNTKQIANQNQMLHRPNHLTDTDPVTFYRNQLSYMQSMIPIPVNHQSNLPLNHNTHNPDLAVALNQNIDFLGGIEDTVGNMQDSLNNYEIRHLINKNIRNYPNPYEIKAPVPIIPKPERTPHPFLYNPAEDLERFKGWKNAPNLDMQQTVQSQFQCSIFLIFQETQQQYPQQPHPQQQIDYQSVNINHTPIKADEGKKNEFSASNQTMINNYNICFHKFAFGHNQKSKRQYKSSIANTEADQNFLMINTYKYKSILEDYYKIDDKIQKQKYLKPKKDRVSISSRPHLDGMMNIIVYEKAQNPLLLPIMSKRPSLMETLNAKVNEYLKKNSTRQRVFSTNNLDFSKILPQEQHDYSLLLRPRLLTGQEYN